MRAEVFIKDSIQSVKLLEMNLEKDERLFVFGCSIQLCISRFANKWRCEDILHSRRLFFLCAFSRSKVLGENSGLGGKERICDHINQSIRRPFNLIVVSKSLPVDVNNSAGNLRMTYICPLRGKKSLKPGAIIGVGDRN